MSEKPKPKRERGMGSEAWMTMAYQAGATMEEIADVLALSVLLDRPCEEIKNIIVDAQVRAKFGARKHVKRFGADLKRLAGDPPGHEEIHEVVEKKIDATRNIVEVPRQIEAPKTEDGEL